MNSLKFRSTFGVEKHPPFFHLFQYSRTDATNFTSSVINTTKIVLYLYLLDLSCEAVTKIPKFKNIERNILKLYYLCLDNWIKRNFIEYSKCVP